RMDVDVLGFLGPAQTAVQGEAVGHIELETAEGRVAFSILLQPGAVVVAAVRRLENGIGGVPVKAVAEIMQTGDPAQAVLLRRYQTKLLGQLPTVGSATVGGVVTYAGVRGRMTGSAPGAVFGFVIPGNRGEGIAAAQIPIQFQQVRKGIGVITRLTGIVIGIRLRLGAIAGSKTIAVAAARLTVNGM